MKKTKLTLDSTLPLTCSRAGTCCYGKAIMLNPWEIFNFSKEKKVTPKEFMEKYCEFGGARLLFNGKSDQKGQKACSQYMENKGCAVHNGRPLACRLYPLGRQTQLEETHYFYQGDKFPCLHDCSEVLKLPKHSVGDYMKGQEAEAFEQAQDAYLLLMQDIADIAFELLLDTGLSASGDTKTLAFWREMGKETPDSLVNRIGSDWLHILMCPDISYSVDSPGVFVHKHKEMLLAKIQNAFGSIQTMDELHKASVLLISLALHMARGLGANPQEISEHWIDIAKSHGALE